MKKKVCKILWEALGIVCHIYSSFNIHLALLILVLVQRTEVGGLHVKMDI